MKTLRGPLILLFLLYLVFYAYFGASSTQLPERVATHFNGSGYPNGWMTRKEHLLFMGIFGFVFPLFIVGAASLSRFLPAWMHNIPRRDYWLMPDKRFETFRYILRHSIWFACMASAFLTGLNIAVVQANTQQPPHLSAAFLWTLVGAFLATTCFWAFKMNRHFRRDS